ncbi:MAG TPA: FumA C-terminus/TtdB family hydratase beta subunit [Candidatus Polarisedimenticolia bacterium]|jgi:fumarate hydratase class I|nr:FumA C-terminus/TtdB family hydratase beta subunit [Candidatus Polarisedimenticolia bacterium]
MEQLTASLLALVTETSTRLPPDVRRAIARAVESEDEESRSAQALDIISSNIGMAAGCEGPLCQDTGWPTFIIRSPSGVDAIRIEEAIRAALVEATRRGKLRPNSVDSLTGKNSGDNLGPGTPSIHFHPWENRGEIEVKLLLKGGGCENKNIQYSLPAEIPHLGRADRDLDGVRKCLLHAVWQAQGHGCSAGALGVCVGGDRASGYEHAKLQLFRLLDDSNPDPRLAELEDYTVKTANALGIGTMGFGGATTLIGCKIGVINRLPASFFVSVAYDCWAFRRLGVVLDAASGAIKRWLYKAEEPLAAPAGGGKAAGPVRTGKEKVLEPPLTEAQARDLRVGDAVRISGLLYTGRDAVHHHLTAHDPPVDLRGQILYHCGPVALKDAGGWRVTAAGPTTSIREEQYEADVIARFGLRAVMGKGGMGPRTLKALKEHGAVYLNAIGGAAQYYARCIEKVEGVDLLDLGIPEAMWHLRVKDFPAIVTMDASGNSLHAEVEDSSAAILRTLAAPVFA